MFSPAELDKFRDLVEFGEWYLAQERLLYSIESLNPMSPMTTESERWKRYHQLKDLIEWLKTRVRNVSPQEDQRRDNVPFDGEDRRA